jgi:hypothetical protein
MKPFRAGWNQLERFQPDWNKTRPRPSLIVSCYPWISTPEGWLGVSSQDENALNAVYTNPRKESLIDVGFRPRMKGDSWLRMGDSLCGLVLECFQPDWKRFNANFASNFIDLTSLRYFQSA